MREARTHTHIHTHVWLLSNRVINTAQGINGHLTALRPRSWFDSPKRRWWRCYCFRLVATWVPSPISLCSAYVTFLRCKGKRESVAASKLGLSSLFSLFHLFISIPLSFVSVFSPFLWLSFFYIVTFLFPWLFCSFFHCSQEFSWVFFYFFFIHMTFFYPYDFFFYPVKFISSSLYSCFFFLTSILASSYFFFIIPFFLFLCFFFQFLYICQTIFSPDFWDFLFSYISIFFFTALDPTGQCALTGVTRL